jgi:TatD DNase family protein
VLIDTHCHIDRFSDPMDLAAKCEAAEVTTIAVTNLPSHYQLAVPHLKAMRYVKPALGFHPLAVADNIRELPLFLSLVAETHYVGEIGLDYSKEGLPSKEQQQRAFRAIAEVLSQTRKFVTLHSRGAAEDVVDILNECGVKNCVFHWYSDSHTTLRRVLAAGHYLSVNTAMLLSKKGQDIVRLVPETRILTETDGPYVKVGRTAAKPLDVKEVLERMGDIWGRPVASAEAQVAANYRTLCMAVGIQNESDHP